MADVKAWILAIVIGTILTLALAMPGYLIITGG